MNVADWSSKGTIHTIHGRKLFAVDTGGDKPVLVLLHGYPTSSHDFHRVLPALAERYRVIVHDHLGFGLSDKPQDFSYALVEQADYALGLWKHLGVKSAHVVAHDYGTSVATELLARWNLGFRPIAIDSITLCNGSVHIELAKLRLIQKLLRNRTLGPLVASLSSKRVFASNMAGLWGDPALLLPADVDAMWELLNREGGKLLLPRISQYLHDRVLYWHRWVGALRQSPLPTNFLWGAEDPIVGGDVAKVHHAETANSKLTVLEGVGHYPMLEAPDRWSSELLKLLA